MTTPASVHSDAGPSPSPAPAGETGNALEKYRDLWQKMTPAQQKAFVDAGGLSPDQYERQFKEKPPGTASNRQPDWKVDPTLDSLTRSLENLDTIRDANLGRVQNQSCPPEVAARIADLKAKLERSEPGSDMRAETRLAASRARENTRPPDPSAIANDWFKPGSATVPSPAADPNQQLVAVLPAKETQRTPVDEHEMARARLELEQLSGACRGAAR
jgi:hypothetical protein